MRLDAIRWRWFIVLGFITAICVALPQDWWNKNHLPAAAMTTLQQADQFELISLDPRFHNPPEKDSFHGYRILSRVIISDKNTRQKLISALRQGMRESSAMAACFNPRHGIHAVRKGKQADLVICFECLHVELFGDAQSELLGEFLVSRSPQAFFDETLKARGSRQ